jgi:hypothetical protein
MSEAALEEFAGGASSFNDVMKGCDLPSTAPNVVAPTAATSGSDETLTA